MFIELTDHLRCPADHEEQFLVLLPEVLAERRVERGQLGCPVCGATWPITGWIAALGGPPPSEEPTALTADAVHALCGLGGPGGALVLVGAAAGVIPDLQDRLEGVHLVGVNPPEGVAPGPGRSLLRAPGIPLKRATARGVVLGGAAGASEAWRAEARRVVLPGLRVVGEGGEPPEGGGLTPLASAGGIWVAEAARG